jgi:penicillin-binding protein-related factor A (putative recombinase)
MTESQMQSSFNNWKSVNHRITCVEELKITKTDRFYLNKIEPHQIANLHNAKHGFIQFKIPDLGNQNPFDSFSMCEVPAYVVVMFYKPRKPKVFYMIDIDVIDFLTKTPKKSITEKECEEMANITGILK